MEFAFFKGCRMPHSLPRYERSTRAVLKALDVQLAEPDFNCCGYPVKDQDYFSYIYSAARNLAIAEQHKLTIMTPCKCCFGNLMHAQHDLKKDEDLKNEINTLLLKEGLEWKGKKDPKHLLSVLRHDIGLETIQKRVVNRLDNYRLAAHYGCHALRPSNIVHFDNPFAPTIFEELIGVTGARAVEWARRLECCGNPVLEKNRRLSLAITEKKLKDAYYSGADYICTACTYCQIQFDSAGKEERFNPDYPGALLYTELLALSFGLDEKIIA